jgi:hypothetical protein
MVTSSPLIHFQLFLSSGSRTAPIQYWPFVSLLQINHQQLVQKDIYAIISPVSAPQFPTDESLQSRVALVNKGATPAFAKGISLPEGLRLPVVENVAFSVVGGRAAGWLIAELGTPFNRQSLETNKSLARHSFL